MGLKYCVCMANNVDPDQTPHSSASDLDRHCLQRPISPSTFGCFGIRCDFLFQKKVHQQFQIGKVKYKTDISVVSTKKHQQYFP